MTEHQNKQELAALRSLVPHSWQDALAPEFDKPYLGRLAMFLAAERATGVVYPPAGQTFRALELTPPAGVAVVILGQDPYHGAGEAHGLAFSVEAGVKIPPSLRNMYKELADDLGMPPPAKGDLSAWARQGVLLLNTSLSVRADSAGSHAKKGWEPLTDAVIRTVAARSAPAVFVLWGAHAQKKAPLIAGEATDMRHTIIATPHPSPLSATKGFFGSKPFSKVNAALTANGRPVIDWSLP